ncbi:hypothetical protein PIB30_034928 [Stylosanthes scabra]|uniref:Uncharacterized protein n=1 Tax=Stylosanthes scabra TaxID=79078 RepID=A0ABU6VBL6_9FABA|nr:hypothetical protein [Stylosanthes scabra]
MSKLQNDITKCKRTKIYALGSPKGDLRFQPRYHTWRYQLKYVESTQIPKSTHSKTLDDLPYNEQNPGYQAKYNLNKPLKERNQGYLPKGGVLSLSFHGEDSLP